MTTEAASDSNEGLPPAARPIAAMGKTVFGICVLLVALTWLVFGQTLGHEFVNYDDPEYVIANPMVNGGFSIKGIIWAFTHSYSSNWHPVTWLSHMLDCQVFGLNPTGHHFTAVLLHTIAVVLLFLLLRQTTGTFWRSAFVAALFAIHPLRVESVAWVAERKDVLSGVFFVLTLMAYAAYTRNRSPVRYFAVATLFALGLMAKPMLVTTPCVLLLLDYWPCRSQLAWPRLILEKIPLFCLSAASCFATILAQRQTIASVAALPLTARIVNAVDSYVTYLGQMVWPVRLAVFYPYLGRSPLSGKILACLIVLLALTAVVIARRKLFPYLVTGWFWYLIMLVPVIGVVQVGEQAHADRYTYLPEIGIALMITWLVVDLAAAGQWPRRALGVAAVVVLGLLAWQASLQASYWRTSETLCRHALSVTSNNWVADNSLGLYLLEKDRVDEAIPYFQQAVRIQPKDTDGHNNLGNALLQKGLVDEAMAQYQEALDLSLAAGDAGDREADYNLGTALLSKGEVAPAIIHFRKALERPGLYTADAHGNLGLALREKGRPQEAIAEFEAALAMKPKSASVQTNLAWLLSTSRDSSIRNAGRGLQLAEQANQISHGENPIVLHTLAAAYAEGGQFGPALATAQRAHDLAAAQGNAGLAATLENEMALYELHLPLRE